MRICSPSYFRAAAFLAALSALGPLGAQQSEPAAAAVRPEYRTAARALVTTSIDRTRLVPTAGAVHSATARATDLGRRDAAAPMEHVQFILRRPAERQAAFDSLVDALHRPGDPSYHQWLTPVAVGSEFGPAPEDLAALTAYLQAEGFTVNFTLASGMAIDFTGTVAQVERSFHTEIHNFRTVEGQTRYSAVQQAQLPAALAPLVTGFVSLSNIEPHGQLRHAVPSALPTPTPHDTTGTGQYQVGPQDFYTIYNERPLFTQATPINGSGITVALLEQTDINTADVTTFRSKFNITPNAPTLTVMHGSASVTCSDPGTTEDEVEAVLDTEWAGATAPAATLLFMSCATKSTAGIFLSAEAVIDNNLASILSLSYGFGEAAGGSSYATFVTNLWEQAAAQGQTVIVSAGDSGSAPSQDQDAAIASHGTVVNSFSASAYNVSAGGTDFQDNYNSSMNDAAFGASAYWNTTDSTGLLSAKSYLPETTWNGTCASSLLVAQMEGTSAGANALCDDSAKRAHYLAPDGGGGGYSLYISRPNWQSGTVYGLPAASGIYNSRLQPDLSLFASNGILGHGVEYYQSDTSTTLQSAGGTSFVAPQLAGIFALISQKTGQRLGQPNYELYALAGNAYGVSSYTPGTTCNGSGATGAGTTSTVPAATCVFYDIETGNNSQACTAGTADCYNTPSDTSYGILSTSITAAQPAFATGQGYDLATGLGSINVTNLVNSWVNPAVIVANPAITIQVLPNPFIYGSDKIPVQVVTSGTNNGFAPTGTIVIVYSGSSFGPYTLSAANCSGGTCTASYTLALAYSAVPPAGTSAALSTTYTSNSQYYNNGSATGTFLVTQQTPVVTLSTPSSYSYGTTSITYSAVVAYSKEGGTKVPAAPSGGMQFLIDGAAVTTATCTAGTLQLTCTATYNPSTVSGGTHTLTAQSLSDTNYTVASSAGANFTVTPIDPTLTFAIPTHHTQDASFTLTATTNSGGALTYSLISGPATLSGATLTLSGAAGTVVVQVQQAATSNYNAASQTASFAVLAGSVWFGNGNASLAEFDFTGAAISTVSGYAGGGLSPITTPLALAFDSAGSVWAADSAGVNNFSRTGVAVNASPYTGGGISTPTGVALDGASQVWVANSNGTVSALTNSGTAISPAGGYTTAGTGVLNGISVDLSGNVWVTSANTLTQFLGAAAPAAPIATAVKNGTTGVRP